MKLAGVLVFVGVVAILYAFVWAMWDVIVRRGDLAFPMRVLWFAVLFFAPVIGTAVYLRLGPGAAHWPPWEDVAEE